MGWQVFCVVILSPAALDGMKDLDNNYKYKIFRPWLRMIVYNIGHTALGSIVPVILAFHPANLLAHTHLVI